jgi:hypothetical protein
MHNVLSSHICIVKLPGHQMHLTSKNRTTNVRGSYKFRKNARCVQRIQLLLMGVENSEMAEWDWPQTREACRLLVAYVIRLGT